MNQFFIGLVERATLRAPVLERRPRSLFEPMAPAMAGQAALDGTDQAEPDDRDPSMGPAPRGGASRGPHRTPTTGADPDARSARIDSSFAVDTVDRSGSSTAPASSPARHAGDEPRLTTPPPGASRQADDERRPVSAAPSPHGELEPAAGLAAAHAATLRVERPQRPPGALSSTRAAGSAAPYPPVRDPDVAFRSPRVQPTRPATADPAALAPMPVAQGGPPAEANAAALRARPRAPGPPALLVRALTAPRAQQADGIAGSAPAPVHVTIGRVEVRASVPAADRPPIRRSPAGPKLSLDDYLNGRRGGSR